MFSDVGKLREEIAAYQQQFLSSGNVSKLLDHAIKEIKARQAEEIKRAQDELTELARFKEDRILEVERFLHEEKVKNERLREEMLEIEKTNNEILNELKLRTELIIEGKTAMIEHLETELRVVSEQKSELGQEIEVLSRNLKQKDDLIDELEGKLQGLVMDNEKTKVDFINCSREVQDHQVTILRTDEQLSALETRLNENLQDKILLQERLSRSDNVVASGSKFILMLTLLAHQSCVALNTTQKDSSNFPKYHNNSVDSEEDQTFERSLFSANSDETQGREPKIDTDMLEADQDSYEYIHFLKVCQDCHTKLVQCANVDRDPVLLEVLSDRDSILDAQALLAVKYDNLIMNLDSVSDACFTDHDQTVEDLQNSLTVIEWKIKFQALESKLENFLNRAEKAVNDAMRMYRRQCDSELEKLASLNKQELLEKEDSFELNIQVIHNKVSMDKDALKCANMNPPEPGVVSTAVDVLAEKFRNELSLLAAISVKWNDVIHNAEAINHELKENHERLLSIIAEIPIDRLTRGEDRFPSILTLIADELKLCQLILNRLSMENEKTASIAYEVTAIVSQLEETEIFAVEVVKNMSLGNILKERLIDDLDWNLRKAREDADYWLDVSSKRRNFITALAYDYGWKLGNVTQPTILTMSQLSLAATFFAGIIRMKESISSYCPIHIRTDEACWQQVLRAMKANLVSKLSEMKSNWTESLQKLTNQPVQELFASQYQSLSKQMTYLSVYVKDCRHGCQQHDNRLKSMWSQSMSFWRRAHLEYHSIPAWFLLEINAAISYLSSSIFWIREMLIAESRHAHLRRCLVGFQDLVESLELVIDSVLKYSNNAATWLQSRFPVTVMVVAWQDVSQHLVNGCHSFFNDAVQLATDACENAATKGKWLEELIPFPNTVDVLLSYICHEPATTVEYGVAVSILFFIFVCRQRLLRALGNVLSLVWYVCPIRIMMMRLRLIAGK